MTICTDKSKNRYDEVQKALNQSAFLLPEGRSNIVLD